MTLPDLPEPFYWTQSACGLVLKCRPLDAVAPHCFTTRSIPVASAADWDAVGEALGAAGVVTLTQVHGRDVLTVRPGSARGNGAACGDALVSSDPDVAVAVRAADCVPLLLGDRRTGVVAAVHAGWRGTAAGAAVAAVSAMATGFGARPEDLTVAVGPSIGPCCYEVGSDLVDAFAAAGHPRHLVERWIVSAPPRREDGRCGLRPLARPSLRLDRRQATRDQLIAAGVPDAQIHDCGLCTAMHLEVLTSYRVEKAGAGRIAGAIRCRPASGPPPDPSPRLPGDRRPG